MSISSTVGTRLFIVAALSFDSLIKDRDIRTVAPDMEGAERMAKELWQQGYKVAILNCTVDAVMEPTNIAREDRKRQIRLASSARFRAKRNLKMAMKLHD